MPHASSLAARLARLAAVAALTTMAACVSPPDTGDAASDATEAGIDATTCGAEPACGAAQLCAFRPGCNGAPVRFCGDNTCGDAVAIYYCGCDGVTFVSGCINPDRPYAHAGTCEDASTAE